MADNDTMPGDPRTGGSKAGGSKAGGSKAGGGTVSIKKYANRRLYNTATSSYVTLDNLAEMIREGVEFTVVDAKTGEDLTRAVLTQIIVEQEGKGQSLLPISVLRQLIGMYGDSMQWMVPGYLEVAMDAFQKNQDRVRGYLQQAFGGMFPFEQLDRMGKQNMAVFEQAMKMFLPAGGGAGAGTGPARTGGGAAGAEAASGEQNLKALQEHLEALKRQIDALTKEQGGGPDGR